MPGDVDKAAPAEADKVAVDPGSADAPAEADGPAATPTGLRRVLADRRWVWLLPAVVAAVVLTMTALGVSGSSVPELTPKGRSDPSVLAGESRPIRSDEWLVRTPMIAGQVQRGFPRYAEVGVGTHDMSVLSDLPTAGWLALFRPHQWAFFVLPLANAFAFEWWTSAAILILGLYAFLLVVVRDWRWAALGALVMYGSPFLHWWYSPTTFATVGWAAAALAVALASFPATCRGWRRWSLVVLAGYLLACFGLFLYPPSQIPVALVLGTVAGGAVWAGLIKGTITWPRALVNSAIAGGIAAAALGAFVVTRAPALTAIVNTVYPGSRVVTGGGGSADYLASGWFGWKYVLNVREMRGIVFPNESEASSFLLLGVFLLPAIPFVWRYAVGVGRAYRAMVIGAVATVTLLLVHMYVGLPDLLGRLTLLNRVPTARALIGLGVGSVLIVVLFGASLERSAAPWRWRAPAALVVTVVGTSAVLTLGTKFRSAGAPVGRIGLLITVTTIGVTALAYFWRPMVAVALLAAIGLAMSLPANPLTRGLDPLTTSTFVTDTRAVAAQPTSGGDVWLATNESMSAVLTAGGLDNLSGVNLYPNADAWHVLDPGGRQEEVWNRYAHTQWVLKPGQRDAALALVQADVLSVTIDPCAPALDTLGVGHLVTPAPVSAPCLTLNRKTTAPTGQEAFIYDRSARRP